MELETAPQPEQRPDRQAHKRERGQSDSKIPVSVFERDGRSRVRARTHAQAALMNELRCRRCVTPGPTDFAILRASVVILSTHIVEDVSELCTRMAIIDKRRILLRP